MPGYRVDTLKPVLGSIECPHCKLILRDAVQTGDGVRLCETCYSEILLAPNHTCPDCEVSASPQEVWPDRAIRREILKIQVHCSFYFEYGCSWQGMLKDLEEHCQDCRFSRRAKCEFCEEEMCAQDIEKHLADCPKYPPNCRGLTCREEFEERKALDCPFEEGEVQDCGKLEQTSGGAAAAGYDHQHLADPQDARIHSLRAIVYSRSDKTSQLQQEVHTQETHLGDLSRTLQQLQRQPFQSAEPEIKSRENQFSTLERDIAEMQIRISYLELQPQSSPSSSHDGTFLWRIPDIARRRRDAVEERITSLYSPPFYTGRNGYKMCMRVYLNGDGIGYKTHFSIFFVLMKGEYDPLLKWPFESKVSLILVDQNHRKHIVQTFRSTQESSSFQRPRSDMNVASGCPQFAKLNVLDDENYVKEDLLFVKCIVDTSRIFHP